VVVADLDVELAEIGGGLAVRDRPVDHVVTPHIEVLRRVEHGLLPVRGLAVGRSAEGDTSLQA